MISLSKARFCDFSHRGYRNRFFWDWLVKLQDNSFQSPYSVGVEDFFEVRFQLIMLCVLIRHFKNLKLSRAKSRSHSSRITIEVYRPLTISVTDNNQYQIGHATSISVHGFSVQTKDVMILPFCWSKEFQKKKKI